MIRRFQHRNGFRDGTAYVQIDDDGKSYLVSRLGLATESARYTLSRCLAFVREGVWIELTGDQQ